jgi:hypothetical protein
MFVVSRNPQSEVNIKIGDFGLSVNSYSNLAEPLESWQWLAPEVLFDNIDSSMQYR